MKTHGHFIENVCRLYNNRMEISAFVKEIFQVIIRFSRTQLIFNFQVNMSL